MEERREGKRYGLLRLQLHCYGFLASKEFNFVSFFDGDKYIITFKDNLIKEKSEVLENSYLPSTKKASILDMIFGFLFRVSISTTIHGFSNSGFF